MNPAPTAGAYAPPNISTSAPSAYNPPMANPGILGKSYDLPSPSDLDINPPQQAYSDPVKSY